MEKNNIIKWFVSGEVPGDILPCKGVPGGAPMRSLPPIISVATKNPTDNRSMALMKSKEQL